MLCLLEVTQMIGTGNWLALFSNCFPLSFPLTCQSCFSSVSTSVGVGTSIKSSSPFALSYLFWPTSQILVKEGHRQLYSVSLVSHCHLWGLSLGAIVGSLLWISKSLFSVIWLSMRGVRGRNSVVHLPVGEIPRFNSMINFHASSGAPLFHIHLEKRLRRQSAPPSICRRKVLKKAVQFISFTKNINLI